MSLPLFRRLCWSFCCLLFHFPANAVDVTVAAASDLNYAIKEIIAKFEQATGNSVKLTLGSSGNFYAQLTNGAPFEVFLSADVSYPSPARIDYRAEPGSDPSSMR